ncbi:putative Protein HID1 [Paratrimastix pyriformis]|uniref:Uncharacterized protein n=1 Tax=Paratrimastix pyriformis TaxID=342808 RepID=A0ABQ8URD0_9EUKA|nr:putative Protein HID1 [Paratrimastix pyriformis]
MGAAGSKKAVYDTALAKLTATGPEGQIPEDSPFWTEFVQLFPTLAEISAIPTDVVRLLKQNNPSNFATLTKKLVFFMIQFQRKPSIDPKVALNCIRLLTRVMNVVLENSNDDSLAHLFWNVSAEQAHVASAPSAPSDEEESTMSPASGPSPTSVAASGVPQFGVQPLGEVMMHTLMELLFLPGFTIAQPPKPTTEELAASINKRLIWEAGVGLLTSRPSAAPMDIARTELLRLLLVCLSAVLYVPPNSVAQFRAAPDRFSAYVFSAECPHKEELFLSLLNTVLAYEPNWKIPFSTFVFSDLRGDLVAMCLKVLVVLLDYKKPGQRQPYRQLLGQMRLVEDHKLIFDGIVRLLNNPMTTAGAYLRAGAHVFPCEQEVLVLLWKLLESAPGFVGYAVEGPRVIELVPPLLFYLNKGKSETSQHGLVHLGTYILLFMSGFRYFGVALNLPCPVRIPGGPVLDGTYADHFFMVIHDVLLKFARKSIALTTTLLTILANVSPYIKSLGKVPASSLVNLFDVFAKPRFLYAVESHYQFLGYLIEVFNNMVQYQYEGNAHLVYNLLLKAKTFERLASTVVDDLPTVPTMPAAPAIIVTQAAPQAAPQAATAAGVAASAAKVVVGGIPAPVESTAQHPVDPPATAYAEGTATFAPTAAWMFVCLYRVLEWRRQLPLETIVRLLRHLIPILDTLLKNQLSSEQAPDETLVVTFLRTSTVVGVLPVPHPIMIRKYRTNQYTTLWFTSYLWGAIYLRTAPPLWDGSRIRLFQVQAV